MPDPLQHPLPEPRLPQPGDLLARKYRIQKLLGQGGMGAVFLAHHELLSRPVAIKVLLPRFAADRSVVSRFVNEARAAAMIKDEHAVAVLDVDTLDDGAAYMVLEYLEGSDLAFHLDRRGALGVPEAVGLTLQALQALAQAHALGVVHRDLKPANLFLVGQADGSSLLKVLDFGISKIADAGAAKLTETGGMLGSPAFMAPEQIKDPKNVDPRADVWSIGVCLYAMLTNSLPFDGTTVGAVLAAVLETNPPAPSERKPGLPPALDRVVARCLSRERDARFCDVGELAEALAPFAPDSARPCLEKIRLALSRADASTHAPGALAAHDSFPGSVDKTDVRSDPGPAGEAVAKTEPSSGARPPSPAPSTKPVTLPSEADWPRQPAWKRLLWWGLVGSVPVVFAGGPLVGKGNAVLQAWLGSPALAAFVACLLAAAGLYAAYVAERFWRRGVFSHWLQGRWFVAIPAGGLLIFGYHWITLGNRIESSLLAERSYSAITSALSERISAMLADAVVGYCNSLGLDAAILSYLALVTVLAYVFHPSDAGAPIFARRHWLLLFVGPAVAVAAELAFPETARGTGPLRFAVPLAWMLVAAAVLRSAREGGGRFSAGARALFSGLVLLASLSAGMSSAGLVSILTTLSTIAPDQRLDVWRMGNAEIASGYWFMGGEMAVLVVVLAAALRRGLVWDCRESVGAKGGGLGAAAAAVAIAVAPMATTPRVAQQMTHAMQMPAQGMRPASLTAGADPSFYIDPAPAALGPWATHVCERVRGRGGAPCTNPIAPDVFSGAKDCAQELKASLGAAGDKALPPARCISAIEAKLVCEAQGKRLPTPEEWDAAVGAQGPAALGEWTMKVVHETPVFEVHGGEADVPKGLPPTGTSPKVGFRCAYRSER